jgi:hypothetical protein
MSARAKRDRLFRKGKPHIRPMDLQTDFWVLWAAYDLGSFDQLPKGWTKEQFAQHIQAVCSVHSSCLVIEDDCKHFKSGRGPSCFVLLDNYGWRVEPVVDFFFWTTPRMKLRAEVAFFQMVRYSGDIGVCSVRTGEKEQAWFGRLREYGVLFPCGKIPKGRADGDEYLFYVNGTRKAHRQEVLPAGEVVMDSVAEA